MHLADPDVHVCRSPQHRPARLRCPLQCLLVGAHGIPQTTLRTPDVRQRDRAAEGVGDVAGPPQARHAFGIRPVPSLEIPAPQNASPSSPRRTAHGDGRPRTERSSARRACRMVPGTSPRARASAARYISIAPGRRRNSSSSTTTISADGASGASRDACRRLQPPLGVLQPGLDARRPRRSPATRPQPTLSTGLARTTSSGSASSQPRRVASCLLLRMAGIAQLHQVGRPLEILGGHAHGGSPRTARRSARTTRSPVGAARERRSGCSSSRCACSTSAKRWW